MVEHTYREFDVVEEQGFDVITSEGSMKLGIYRSEAYLRPFL